MDKKTIVLRDIYNGGIDVVFSALTTTAEDIQNLIYEIKNANNDNDWTLNDILDNLPEDVEIIFSRFEIGIETIYY